LFPQNSKKQLEFIQSTICDDAVGEKTDLCFATRPPTPAPTPTSTSSSRRETHHHISRIWMLGLSAAVALLIV
jgi:hypothetical protein